ncbi:MAG: hypothetical protein ACLUHE_02465 [Christensenellales bacterium]
MLEEYQIDNVGHVDAGIHHINADGDLRHAAAHLELLDQREIVLHTAVDQLTEIHPPLRINLLESLDNLLRLNVALQANMTVFPISASPPSSLQTVLHQVVQHRASIVPILQIDDVPAELNARNFLRR